MLSYEDRIAFNLALIGPGFLIICLRLWVRNKYRPPKPPLTWILSDVFLILEFIIASFVVGVDVHILVRKMRLEREYLSGGKNVLYFMNETKQVTEEFLKGSLFYQFAYVVCLWCLKASFLCSYYTMSPHLSKRLRGSLKFTWVALLLTLGGLILGLSFWCRPIERNWSLDLLRFCSPQAKTEQAILVYGFHILTDVPVMTIPFFIIRTLNLGRSERYAIGFMFLLGFLTAVCSTFSFVLHLQFIQLDQNPNSTIMAQGDKLEGIYLSACAEVWGAAFVVCLPSTRIAFRLFRNRYFGRNNDDITTFHTNEEEDEREIELGRSPGSDGKGSYFTSRSSAVTAVTTVTEEPYINRKLDFGRNSGTPSSYDPHRSASSGSYGGWTSPTLSS